MPTDNDSPTPVQPIDLSDLKTYPLRDRPSKVTAADFAHPWEKGGSFSTFLERLPNILAAQDIRAVIDAIVQARRNQKPVIMGMGGHVIKVGLNPIVIDLMQRGVISGVAMNGSCIIHDLEVALAGKTSEDVGAALGEGRFGMARETGDFLSECISRAGRRGAGLGQTVGQSILDRRLALADTSILAQAARLGIPATVHVAIGTDILHMHPQFDPGAAGKASHHDFRVLAALVADLEGGVYLNVGSAVVLPEVFLKVVTIVRNLGYPLENFTTANMDFIRHYRPMANVVSRPTAEGGRGYNLVGHHELNLPLIAAGVIEALES